MINTFQTFLLRIFKTEQMQLSFGISPFLPRIFPCNTTFMFNFATCLVRKLEESLGVFVLFTS